MIIVEGYQLDFKVGRQTCFVDGRITNLIDVSHRDYQNYLQSCREVAPETLYELPVGAVITYVRRDNSNIVRDMRITRQQLSQGGDPITQVVSTTTYKSPPRFYLKSADIVKLYVVDREALYEQVATMNATVATMNATIASLTTTVVNQQKKIDRLIEYGALMKQAIQELQKQALSQSRCLPNPQEHHS